MKTNILVSLISFGFLLSIGAAINSAWAQDVLELSTDEVVEAKDASTAKEEMARSSVENATIKYIKDLIGESKYEQNKALISAKIIRQSNRFIPLVRQSQPVMGPDGKWGSTVSFKLSIKDLRKLLLKEGLLLLTDGAPVSIPFIAMLDRANGKSHRWWIDGGSTGFLGEQHDKLISAMRAHLGKKGFYLVDPVKSSLRDLIPISFRGESFRTEDTLLLGEFFKSQVMIEGKVIIERNIISGSTITADFQAIETSNGRSVAEITRVLQVKAPPTEAAMQKVLGSFVTEVSEEFAAQLLDIWQKGILGANLLRLALRGSFSPQEVDSFKSEAQRLSEIKIIRERSFSQTEVIFECEATGGAKQVAERLKSVRPNWDVQVASTDAIVIQGR